MDITANFPNLPEGQELDIGGVLVKNGETTEINEDQELTMVSRWQKAVEEKLADNEYIEVSGSAKYGPDQVAEMFPPVEPRGDENPYNEDSGEEEKKEETKEEAHQDGGEE